jgi:hypothetical protein
MRRKLIAPVVIFALGAVLGASCTRSAEGQLPTPEMISDVLPTITDMPGEWDESQRQVFDVRGPENPSIDPSVWCPAAGMVTENLVDLAGQSGADVEMMSQGPSGTPRMMRLQAWANDDVEDYFRDAREAAMICDGESVTADSGAVETYSVVEGRDIGDESVSWVQKTTPPPATQSEKMESVSRTTIARFGSIVMAMQLGDVAFTGSAVAMDEDEWWSVVELAGKKLDTLDSQVRK